jgi:hypothetical protein
VKIYGISTIFGTQLTQEKTLSGTPLTISSNNCEKFIIFPSDDRPRGPKQIIPTGKSLCEVLFCSNGSMIYSIMGWKFCCMTHVKQKFEEKKYFAKFPQFFEGKYGHDIDSSDKYLKQIDWKRLLVI